MEAWFRQHVDHECEALTGTELDAATCAGRTDDDLGRPGCALGTLHENSTPGLHDRRGCRRRQIWKDAAHCEHGGKIRAERKLDVRGLGRRPWVGDRDAVVKPIADIPFLM